MTQTLMEPPATETSPRFIANCAPLLAAVEAASAVVSERPAKPALGGLLIEATADSITIFGTNLEIGVSAECSQVQVERAGVMVLPAIKLRELLKLEDSDTVTIDCVDDSAFITSDSNKGKLQALKVSEFPPTKSNHLKADGWVTAKTEDLRRALRRVLPFVGDLSRHVWQGILLDCVNGEMTTVGGKGNIVAIDVVKVEGHSAFSQIIPEKAAERIANLNGDETRMLVTERFAIFESDGTRITTNLIEGEYAPYRDVIPKHPERTLQVDAATLVNAVRRASMFCDPNFHAICLDMGQHGVKVYPARKVGGDSETVIACKFNGQPVKYGANVRFFIDALRGIEEDAKLEFISDCTPMLVTSSNSRFACVFSPVNIK